MNTFEQPNASAVRLASPQHVRVGGLWGQCLEGTCRQWMLKISNAFLLGGFRNRPGIQAWIGEHAGKYLLAALPTATLLRSPELELKLRQLVEGLVACQEADGYMGTYLPERRWRTFAQEGYGCVWDVWVHKYVMLAMLAHYAQTGCQPALDCAQRAGDLLIRQFGPGGSDINATDQHHGLASGSVIEAIVRLHQVTRERRYLDFARHLLRGWEAPDGPRLIPVLRERADVSTIGNGKAYEMMSCLVGLTEFARASGESEYLPLLLAARDRIADTQRYPTGGMSVNEHFRRPGLLPEWGNIETCVTFTWMQWNLRLFELTGDERALDLVEEAAWNQLLPALSPNMDTWSYHLSMTGPKRFFKQWVQGVHGNAPDSGAPITCCHTNGQRGLAIVPLYAFATRGERAVLVNLYGAATAELALPSAGTVCVEQVTDFPRSEEVVLHAEAKDGAEYELHLRRPPWANRFEVDGREADATARRIVLRLRGRSTVHLRLGMEPRIIWTGLEARGKCAAACGPLVMALDEAPAGLALDRIGLALGSGNPTRHIQARRTRDGWPALAAPAMRLPNRSVFTEAPEAIGSIQLIPVLKAGLHGNPSLTEALDGQRIPFCNSEKQRQTQFPEYRVQLPCYWCPDKPVV